MHHYSPFLAIVHHFSCIIFERPQILARTIEANPSHSPYIYIYISIRYIEIVIPGCALPYEISTGRSLLCARGQ